MNNVVRSFAMFALAGTLGCAAEGLDDPAVDEIEEAGNEEVASVASAISNGNDRNDLIRYSWDDDNDGHRDPQVFVNWGPFGDLGDPVFCEPGSFVRGFKIKVEQKLGGSGDDTALNAISLRCYKESDGNHLENLVPDEGAFGTWSSAVSKCPGRLNFVDGARLLVEPPQGSDDDTGGNDVELACKDGGTIRQNNGISFPASQWKSWTTCPTGSSVCGAAIQMETYVGGGHDDTAMNGLALYCCWN